MSGLGGSTGAAFLLTAVVLSAAAEYVLEAGSEPELPILSRLQTGFVWDLYIAFENTCVNLGSVPLGQQLLIDPHDGRGLGLRQVLVSSQAHLSDVTAFHHCTRGHRTR